MKANNRRHAEAYKPALLPIFAVQIILLVSVSAALFRLDSVLAYSVALGGLISIVPNSYFARWAFRYSGARAARQVAQSFYRGEAGKFVLTVLLFSGAFALVKPLNVPALFAAYIFVMVLNWFLTLWMNNKR